MNRTSFGWPSAVLFAAILTVGCIDVVPAQQPPTEPIPRIETGMHGAIINRIGVDTECRLMVTGSNDKTARVWALPENSIGEPKLQQVLRVPIGAGDAGKIFAVALSPDGHLVAVGGADGGTGVGDDYSSVYIFDSRTGKMLHRGERLNGYIFHLTFSPDGKYLAATLGLGYGVRIWESSTWQLVGKDDQDYGIRNSFSAAFDAADRLYTVAGDGFLRRYGPDFKLEAKSKALGGKSPNSVAVHPNGDRVAVGFNYVPLVEVYRTEDLTLLFAADTKDVKSGDLRNVAWSMDGARLYAGGQFSERGLFPIRIWDEEGRGKGLNVAVTRNTIQHLLPCGHSIALSSQEPAFGLISAAGEKQVWQEGSVVDMRDKLGPNFTVSEDGSKVRFGLGVGGERPVLFDLTGGRLTDQPRPAAGLSAANTGSLKVEHWRSEENPQLNSKPLELFGHETSRALAIAPAADRFILGTDWRLRAYGKDGKQVWDKQVPGRALGVNIPRKGKFIIAAYDDGTIRWHRLSDGEELLALFVNAKTREWVLWTPQGYYMSSVAGDQIIGWHINHGWEQAGEFVAATRLKKHLYRPDIVKRSFELADVEAAVREAGLSGFKLADLANHTPPEFRIVDPGDKTHADKSPVAVKLELSETNDPVTGFDIKVNGRQVTPRDVRDIGQQTKEAKMRTLNIPMEKGENRIQVTARNGVGETMQDLLVYLDREGVLNQKGKLFIVAVGIDNYPKLGSRYSLRYAGADARLMLDTLTQKAGPLHTEVVSKLLVSDGDTRPTKANIEDALAIFRDARPEDTVILFLASHGVNDGPNYLMIPEDAERNDGGQWRPSSVVKWTDLQQALQDAQGSRIMFVDTCHSSGAYSPRLVKDAADANIVVFSATDKETEAQETSKLGHGVFTYAVSQGINGGADFGKTGRVNMWALAEYVSDEVKRLTDDEQEPVVSTSGVKNFVVATP
jgi:WD40 repeat protein